MRMLGIGIFRVIATASALIAVSSAAISNGAETPARPNVILIMSDDMGFSDVSPYGGNIQTPTLQALADGGLRFREFYNTARCCPTRASLLTGLYPHQAGVGHMMADRGYEGYRGDLSSNAVTIAEVLKPAGYRNYAVGKWHVTRFTELDGPDHNWPLQRGFEKYYGTLHGAGSFYDPSRLTRQNTWITPENDTEYQPETYYYTDAISDNAVKFLQQHEQESSEQPFFLYVAYTAAHWPMHALDKDIAKYKGKFDDGYQPQREARLKRLKELGLVDQETPLSDPAEDWSRIENKAWEARNMEVFAAMIDNMDAGIGRIVEQLKASGDYENTVIFFLQDNGACAELVGRQNNGPGPDDLVALGKDGLQTKVSPPMQTRDGRWVKTGPQVLAGPEDSYIAYGRGWANVSNTPFREYKHWVHEGGISSPLIYHWPAGISSERVGKIENQSGHLIDIMATCIDLAGATYPTEFKGKPIKPFEGVSLRPALESKELNRKNPLFWEHEGNRAIRDGQWKLVAKENEPWELYDISIDRVETHDLAAQKPELVQELAAKWDAYAEHANVLPLGAWRANFQPESTSVKTHFELKAGDVLTSAEAPQIVRRGVRVEAEVVIPEDNSAGVIVAQGGAANGYVLFVQNGIPRFAVRSGAKVTVLAADKKVNGSVKLEGKLTPDGKLSLIIDGQPIAESLQSALPAGQPTESLEVGKDSGTTVGPYGRHNEFKGQIQAVRIEVLDN